MNSSARKQSRVVGCVLLPAHQPSAPLEQFPVIRLPMELAFAELAVFVCFYVKNDVFPAGWPLGCRSLPLRVRADVRGEVGGLPVLVGVLHVVGVPVVAWHRVVFFAVFAPFIHVSASCYI